MSRSDNKTSHVLLK